MAKSLYRIENALFNKVWCLKPDVYYSMIKQLQSYYVGEKKADLMDSDSYGDPDNDIIDLDLPSNVALISIDGVIGKHLSLLETQCGGVDIDQITQDLNAANASADIEAILLYINSPGGTVVGVPELAQLIKEISQHKDVICYVDVMACSAGYWLASQCTAIYCAPSALIGNVGAYNIFADETAALEKEGILINCIASDPLKVAGAPWMKMTDDIKARFTADVMKTKEQFQSAIQTKRQVADDVLTGWTYDGDEAVENNLADGTLNNINDLVSSFANN
jgi:signal peptide peptidase SppA